MDHVSALRSPRGGASPAAGAGATVVVLLVTVVLVVLAALLPGARQPLVQVSALASAALIVAVVLRRRPVPTWPWLVVAAMVGLWGLASCLADGPVSVGLPASFALAAGQGCGAVLAVHLAFPRGRSRRPGVSTVDLLLVALTLALVGAQLVLVASDRGARTAVAVGMPSIDVVLLGLVVVYSVSRRGGGPAVALTLLGAHAYLVVDLVGALDGFRVLPAEHPGLVAAVAVSPLLVAGALHPSMTRTFDRDELAEPRPPAAALLGLLPLVAVPPALWAVAEITAVRGLPTPVLLLVGGVVSALCLVRAATALDATEVLARHDPLTGLLNRHGLEAAHAGSSWETTGLLLVDVDEFKSINDTHGHDVGDTVLLALRDRLAATAGRDALVARLGGDEFVLLCEGARAEETAGAVLASLRLPVEVGSLQVLARASIGVATTGNRTGAHRRERLSLLLTQADVAMYAAKAAGRDTAVTYRPQMRADVAHRFTLGNELRVLLGRPGAAAGRLEVHYQVLVELGCTEGDERTVGAEALVRWRHPRLGMLAPGDFLELVSTSGLDAELDEAVLREVVDQIARWRSQGRTVAPVSVNLTRASLVREDLVELVLTVLVDAGVPAALLHLEITEHEQLPADDRVATRLLALDGAGVMIHLDDYGTGYTSMDYLRRFPVRVLKIDRAVTTTLDELSGGVVGSDRCSIPAFRGSIVGGLVAMTEALGLDMLAEGVETREQATVLRSMGVRYAQGYLYGRPQAAAEHALSARSAVGPVPFPRADDVAAASPLGLTLPG